MQQSLTEKNTHVQVTRKDVWWNMAGSLISAASSFLLLLFVTRFTGAAEGGVFSLAYATAQIFLTVGKFGVRSFQATDIRDEISFRTYRNTRVLFCIGMLAFDALYLLISGQTKEKTLVFFFVCLIKMADAIEDVYHGQMQKTGRLALAGKLLAFRNACTIAVFGLAMWFFRKLLPACEVTAAAALATALAGNVYFYHKDSGKRNVIGNKEPAIDKAGIAQAAPKETDVLAVRAGTAYEGHEGKVTCSGKQTASSETVLLLKNCAPLFLGTFLSLVIYNIPKYVIDTFGTDEQIACYTILFMPTFVINLLSDFIFKPLLTDMAYDWEQKRFPSFLKRIHRLMAGIVLLSAAVCLGAWLVGTQVLSWFYAVDVTAYRLELCVLMLGGGCSAAVYLLYNVLTCMRKQGCILAGYAAAAAVILVLCLLWMEPLGILGQTAAYLVTELLLALAYYLMVRLSAAKENKNISA